MGTSFTTLSTFKGYIKYCYVILMYFCFILKVLKKYRAAVQQVSAEQAQLQEAQVQIAALEAEKASLKDQLSELSQRLESVEQLGDPTANSLATRRLEFRTKELESKLELEQTTRARLEVKYLFDLIRFLFFCIVDESFFPILLICNFC